MMLMHQEEAKRAYREAREHLSFAWRELILAQTASAQDGHQEVSRVTGNTVEMVKTLMDLCVSLPQLLD